VPEAGTNALATSTFMTDVTITCSKPYRTAKPQPVGSRKRGSVLRLQCRQRVAESFRLGSRRELPSVDNTRPMPERSTPREREAVTSTCSRASGIVDEFRINSDGSLTKIGASPSECSRGKRHCRLARRFGPARWRPRGQAA